MSAFKILGIMLCLPLSLWAQSPSSYTNHVLRCRKLLATSTEAQLPEAWTRLVVDSLIPSWYGTPWNFYGISERPGKGNIACGYFVSTVLRDAGFNMNRYHMAQAHSFDEVKQFCPEHQHLLGRDSLLTFIPGLRNGLYLLGLDNHIGFLSIEKGNAYFIHSDYHQAEGVKKELLESSKAVANSNHFYVGAISTSKESMKILKNRKEITFSRPGL